MLTITGKPRVPLGGHGLLGGANDDAMMSEATSQHYHYIGMQIKFN